jgi:ribose transport system permease protein
MKPYRTALRRAAGLFVGGSGTVYAVLIVVFTAIIVLNPAFAEPPSVMAFVKKAAPLVLLAVGQYFVIVAGEFDLSVGSLVGFQVVLAALLIDGHDNRTLPVIGLMLVIGIVVGLVNGLVTTFLKVPSIITTLGTMLVLYGAIRLWTGGAPTGALSQAFRAPGRQGIDDIPLLGQLPWALPIVVGVVAVAVLATRSPYGRTLIATGDSERAAQFSGVRVWWVRTIAFVVSGVAATGAGVLIGGYAGVTAQVGQGLEFVAITAVVLGGVVLGGGRGSVIAAVAGAVTVEALFNLFNQLSLPATLRPTAQGLIIIAAVGYAARERVRRLRTNPVPQPLRHSDVATS